METLRKLCLCTSLLLMGTIGISGLVSAAHAPDLPHQVQTVTKANLHWYEKTMPSVVKNELPALMQWNTMDTDVTAAWPSATDPTRQLPIHIQEQFACIRYQESRNHLTSVNVYSGAGGWYQFTPYIWSFARGYIHGLPATPQMATGDQQSLVAVWYYQRNHSLVPEWGPDLRICK
jgi:hypothetical protein